MGEYQEMEHRTDRSQGGSDGGEAQRGQREGASLGGEQRPREHTLVEQETAGERAGGAPQAAGAERKGGEQPAGGEQPKGAEKAQGKPEGGSDGKEPVNPTGDGSLGDMIVKVATGVAQELSDLDDQWEAKGTEFAQAVKEGKEGAKEAAQEAKQKAKETVESVEGVKEAEDFVTKADAKASENEAYQFVKGALLEAAAPSPYSPASTANHELKEIVDIVDDYVTWRFGDDPQAADAAADRAMQRMEKFYEGMNPQGLETIGAYLDARERGESVESALATGVSQGAHYAPFAGGVEHFQAAREAHEAGDDDKATREFVAGVQSWGYEAIKYATIAAGIAGAAGGMGGAAAAEGATARGVGGAVAEGAAGRGAPVVAEGAAGEGAVARGAAAEGAPARAVGEGAPARAAGEGVGERAAKAGEVDPYGKTEPAGRMSPEQIAERRAEIEQKLQSVHERQAALDERAKAEGFDAQQTPEGRALRAENNQLIQEKQALDNAAGGGSQEGAGGARPGHLGDTQPWDVGNEPTQIDPAHNQPGRTQPGIGPEGPRAGGGGQGGHTQPGVAPAHGESPISPKAYTGETPISPKATTGEVPRQPGPAQSGHTQPGIGPEGPRPGGGGGQGGHTQPGVPPAHGESPISPKAYTGETPISPKATTGEVPRQPGPAQSGHTQPGIGPEGPRPGGGQEIGRSPTDLDPRHNQPELTQPGLGPPHRGDDIGSAPTERDPGHNVPERTQPGLGPPGGGHDIGSAPTERDPGQHTPERVPDTTRSPGGPHDPGVERLPDTARPPAGAYDPGVERLPDTVRSPDDPHDGPPTERVDYAPRIEDGIADALRAAIDRLGPMPPEATPEPDVPPPDDTTPVDDAVADALRAVLDGLDQIPPVDISTQDLIARIEDAIRAAIADLLVGLNDVRDEIPSTREAEDEIPSTREAEDGIPSTREAEDEIPSTREAEDEIPSTREPVDEIPSTREPDESHPPDEVSEAIRAAIDQIIDALRAQFPDIFPPPGVWDDGVDRGEPPVWDDGVDRGEPPVWDDGVDRGERSIPEFVAEDSEQRNPPHRSDTHGGDRPSLS